MLIYAWASAFVYSFGIPAALLVALYRHRHELNPPKYEDEARAVKARMKNKALLADPVIGLALPYKPRFWWYEVYSLARRFALTVTSPSPCPNLPSRHPTPPHPHNSRLCSRSTVCVTPWCTPRWSLFAST